MKHRHPEEALAAMDAYVPDKVILPHHYARFAIEPVRFIMENRLPFWAGNVVKYVCREDAKNGLEDLKKARRYLDMEIERREHNPDWWGAPKSNG
jgi:hypothetical protein